MEIEFLASNRHMRHLLLSAALAASLAGVDLQGWRAEVTGGQRATVCFSASVPGEASRTVRVPIEITNNHVFVTACADERQLDLLLDTGAARSNFDMTVARSLGIEFDHTFQARGAGAGSVAASSFRPRSVTIAGTTLTQPVGMAIDFERLTPREGRRIDGVLGADFIKRFVVEIDYHNSELRLHDKDGFRYTGGGASVPLAFANDHPVIGAALRLKDGEVLTGQFIVDVGASGALSLVKAFVEKHRLRERVGPVVMRRSGGGVGGPAESAVGRVAALSIGSVELPAPVTNMYGDAAGVFSSNPHWIGNIGGDVLRRFTVYFDYQGKRMILESNQRFGEPFETDMSGATFIGTADPGQLTVDHIVAGSPAAESGLQVGDVIVEVEDQPVGARTLLDLRDRLRRDSEAVQVTVVRNGARHTVSFKTRRLV